MLSHILTATYKAIVTLCLPFRVRLGLGLGLGLVPAGGLGRSPPAAAAAGPGRWGRRPGR